MINKEFKPLDKNKKEILKTIIGSVSSLIDFNKVREEWKYSEQEEFEDKQNEYIDNLHQQELETQQDLINSTR